MARKVSGEKVEKSSFFKKARKSALDYIKNPRKLNRLLDQALTKSEASRERLVGVWDSLLACLRLLRAYAGGSYREIPWESLVSIAAAVIYFVMPLDMIPDFILSLGLVDDAALLSWILSSVKHDIDLFLEWEKGDAPDEKALPDDSSRCGESRNP